MYLIEHASFLGNLAGIWGREGATNWGLPALKVSECQRVVSATQSQSHLAQNAQGGKRLFGVRGRWQSRIAAVNDEQNDVFLNEHASFFGNLVNLANKDYQLSECQRVVSASKSQ